MPNDNTHTGIEERLRSEWRSGKHGGLRIFDRETWVRLDDVIRFSASDTRTPAQPKAGDWEQKLEPFVKSRLAVGESAIVKVTRLSKSTFEQYEPSKYRYELIRALSSAAPRITEEMVEGIAAELLEAYGKWVPDYRHAIADMKEAFLALLRQPPPFTPTQTEE